MYHASPLLHSIRSCKLVGVPISEYVIRTQPTEGCLSTLETGALALSILEGNPELKDQMLGPLHYLCRSVSNNRKTISNILSFKSYRYQLQNGAVTHQSKEFRIKQNTYPKLIGKRLAKQLKVLPEVS